MMALVNMAGRFMSVMAARLAIHGTDKTPATAKMHPVQVVAISELYSVIAIASYTAAPQKLEDIESVEKLAKEYLPITFLGMKIEQDVTMPESTIEFRSTEGDLIGFIVNLAIPPGYATH